jgi:uncharacterized repeat protein (TIGR03843 family)
MTERPADPAAGLRPPADDAEARALLLGGEIDLEGRMLDASNVTLVGYVRTGELEAECVYKPVAGERPLWDFPDGTLAGREVSAALVSEATGWRVVPPTVLRDGPLGVGMVQRFVDHDPEEHYFTLLEEHADRFRQFAVFDVLVNNADRKGGHCILSRPNGAIVGIDHGLTFHSAWKLRTVIWDFAGEAVSPQLADDVCRVAVDVDGPLGARLTPLVSTLELDAVRERANELIEAGRLPDPDPGYHSLPWPLV